MAGDESQRRDDARRDETRQAIKTMTDRPDRHKHAKKGSQLFLLCWQVEGQVNSRLHFPTHAGGNLEGSSLQWDLDARPSRRGTSAGEPGSDPPAHGLHWRPPSELALQGGQPTMASTTAGGPMRQPGQPSVFFVPACPACPGPVRPCQAPTPEQFRSIEQREGHQSDLNTTSTANETRKNARSMRGQQRSVTSSSIICRWQLVASCLTAFRCFAQITMRTTEYLLHR